MDQIRGTIRSVAIIVAMALALGLAWELAAWAMLGYPIGYLGMVLG